MDELKVAGMRREWYQRHRRHHRGRTRHHCATPYTYSHRRTHVFTPFFFHTSVAAHSARERSREARRHAPDALSGLGTAKDHPRAGPDRPGAGPELPGAPDATAPTWAARARPGPRMEVPEHALCALARPSHRPPPAPGAPRARRPHRRVRRRSSRPRPWPYRPPRAVVPALERREQRVRAGMMGSRAPSSRHCGGRAPSEARGIRPSRYRPDGPGTPRGGRLDRGRPAGPQDGLARGRCRWRQ